MFLVCICYIAICGDVQGYICAIYLMPADRNCPPAHSIVASSLNGCVFSSLLVQREDALRERGTEDVLLIVSVLGWKRSSCQTSIRNRRILRMIADHQALCASSSELPMSPPLIRMASIHVCNPTQKYIHQSLCSLADRLEAVSATLALDIDRDSGTHSIPSARTACACLPPSHC